MQVHCHLVMMISGQGVYALSQLVHFQSFMLSVWLSMTGIQHNHNSIVCMSTCLYCLSVCMHIHVCLVFCLSVSHISTPIWIKKLRSVSGESNIILTPWHNCVNIHVLDWIKVSCEAMLESLLG